ncbi:type II toxin-antitoxin system VapC family toxin [Lyngbya confervoides]|uniref:Type II toxin-antitoxin system VapC family toxin n=1 Tax=Lyngbya confervoides BDU141951 TaxID=1574623 RepID=A0ABD4T4L1_9CYAN|nr:type II toxin-antitoxin system VapC family toxin [Lyngbya confervoides]MCM1983157.1 type II toxin-antitoxin system VapC family toxin [Lyngbya confervoides BDU141951]
MKLLLDTHTFIWWDSQSSQIPTGTLDALSSSDNELLLSLVSVWEIQIKSHLGKLELKEPLLDIVQRQESQNGVVILPMTLAHIIELDQLPWHHKDPFDRLLIAQSRVETATLVSKDPAFAQYDCQRLW